MSKILEKATSHFRNQIGGEMKKITVPEWECDLYFKSVNNLREEGRLIELAQQGKTVEALVEALIMKARNIDGSKMFSLNDKMVLMNEVDPQVIIRVVGEMNTSNAENSNLEEIQKN